jgi:hypothetical protein
MAWDNSPHLSPITCPDCIGVLSTRVEEPAHVQFECQVGHRYSLHSVLEAKERQVETELWSAVALLKHITILSQAVAEETELTQQAMQRKQQAESHIKILQKIIEETKPPNLDSDADPSVDRTRSPGDAAI